MKILKILALVTLALIAFQNAKAQNPIPANIYSFDQLESIMRDFFKMDAKDVFQPEPVILEAFNKHFPNVVDIDWETNNEYYWVDFEIGMIDYDAFYDSKANLLYYKHDVAYSKVPNAVRQAVQERYRGMRVDDADKIITGSGTQYEISLEKGEYEVDVYFDENGKVLKEKAS